MQLGSTFSHPHLKWLGYDPSKALKEFKSFGFSWIRLGVYWNEIEKTQGEYDFKTLDSIVTACAKEGLNIVLTVGMKAPRYPEYYIPEWTFPKKGRLARFDKTDDIFPAVESFITQTILHFKPQKAIKVWQVENEPFDPSGEKWWRISSEFLEKETETIRSIDTTRKVMVTLWGNELGKRKLYKKVGEYADIIGIDLYLRHPMFYFFNFFNTYAGPLDSPNKIREIKQEIERKGKELWIAELQAEPWETDEAVTKQENPPSFSPHHFESNFNYGLSLKPSVLFLWGFEWWYHKKQLGDSRYWDEVHRVLNRRR